MKVTCLSRRHQVFGGAQLGRATLFHVTFDGIVAGKEGRAHSFQMLNRCMYMLIQTAYVQQKIETPGCTRSPNIRCDPLVETPQPLLLPNTLHAVQYAIVLGSQVQPITHYIKKD